MIVAGAGSGKTKVLTTRIAWLMFHHKVDAFNILALTFTNKAAAEQEAKVQKCKLAGERIGLNTIRTEKENQERGKKEQSDSNKENK